MTVVIPYQRDFVLHEDGHNVYGKRVLPKWEGDLSWLEYTVPESPLSLHR